jgi:putative transcriptional regulator
LLNTKILRSAKGFTVAELARRSGVARGYLCEMEKGKYDNPGLKIICSLCNALECTPNDLIPEELYKGG